MPCLWKLFPKFKYQLTNLGHFEIPITLQILIHITIHIT